MDGPAAYLLGVRQRCCSALKRAVHIVAPATSPVLSRQQEMPDPGRRLPMNQVRRWSALFCVAALATTLLASCGDPTGDLQPSIAIVYGVVADASGTPVSDAHVRVLIGAPDSDHCGAYDWLAGTTTTDDSGAYSVTGTFVHVSRAEMCVALEVHPASADYLPDSLEGGRVLFRHEANTPPVDSIRIDAMLEFSN